MEHANENHLECFLSCTTNCSPIMNFRTFHHPKKKPLTHWQSVLIFPACFPQLQVEGEMSSVPECPWKLYLVACFPMICPACPGDLAYPEANLREERPWHQYF
ncbi:uncharacterized protein LOC144308152 [Canis aureus]